MDEAIAVEGTPDQIKLDFSSEDLSKMPVLEQTGFVLSNLAWFTGSPHMP